MEAVVVFTVAVYALYTYLDVRQLKVRALHDRIYGICLPSMLPTSVHKSQAIYLPEPPKAVAKDVDKETFANMQACGNKGGSEGPGMLESEETWKQ